MASNLPTELLRSFVAIVDTGSMLRATERIYITQSALSLQMKRLEDLLQRQLFRRHGRKLVLTPAGTQLLAFARELLDVNDRAIAALAGETVTGQVRVGMVQDFAEALLAGVLRQFSQLHPHAQLEVRVAGSREMIEALHNDQLDLVLCVASADQPEAIKRVPMVWIGSPELAEKETIPIALLAEPCIFRAASLKALEEAGVRYRIVMETPNLTGLRAAVAAGIGITCRSPLFVEEDPMLHHMLSRRLPTLPDVAYAFYDADTRTPASARLGELIRSAVTDLE